MKIDNSKNTELTFTITEIGTFLEARAGEQIVLIGRFDGEKLIVSLRYDLYEEMLSLTAEAALHQQVRVVLMPHRIELYCDGHLEDEEWPRGGHFLETAELTKAPADFGIGAYTEPERTEPTVLGCFQNAEGWQPEKNVFVGDCMPYTHDGRYHVLYLKDRHRHGSKWGRGAHQWAHISTDDFVNWQIHPLAVEITEAWEGSICTGSWISKGEKQYLFYTVRTCDGTPAPLRRSVSDDGYHFRKDLSFSFTISERYQSADARDPKVVWGEDGRYHMFLTTSVRETKLGCLVHLVSEDLDHWTELSDPIYIASNENQPECPDYFAFGGFYYLIFSHYGKGEYLYSDRPFDGWKKPADNRIDCKSVPKMAIWNDQIIFAGFDGGGQYGGTMTFMQAKQNPDGTLRFYRITD